MDGSIHLSAKERKRTLKIYRTGTDVRMIRRAHVLLLLDKGFSDQEICQTVYLSIELIADVKARYLAGGLEAALRGGDLPAAGVGS